MMDKFRKKIQNQEKIIEKESVSFNILGSLRLIAFVFILYLSYRYVKVPLDINFYLLLMSLVVFIGLVIFHIKVKDRIGYAKNMVAINKRYIDRINGDWIDFPDMGEEFIDKTHRYSSDLDIVGDRSLFQLINLTHTFYGRKILAKNLLEGGYTKEEILDRQGGVSELADKLDFCQELELKASDEVIKNPEKMIDYFHESEQVYSKGLIIFLRILPIFTIIGSGTILLLKLQNYYKLVFFIFAFQALIWLFGMNKNNLLLEKVGYLSSSLGNYIDILRLIEKESFTSSLLKEMKEKLLSKEASSLLGIKKLETITQMISIRGNGLLYIAFNILFLWDYQSAFSLEMWKKNFGKDVETWLYSIGEIEALMSLAVPLQIEESLTYPIVDDTSFTIDAKEIGHPLINKEDRVYNDILVDNKILIITGSNMSGKTTFLRTLGINIVLTNAGGPVYSKELKLPIMDLYTSMRISDDLKNKISTFYGELLRIKDILDYGESHKNTFFLIDEIFRGTNSEDRIYGAKNVLRNLNKSGLMGAITTHDLEICELDTDERIVNYNFSEKYLEGLIDFDYKIKRGKSTTTNAKHLMKTVGIDLLE